MRPGKHDLHFLMGVELLPHAFVNIPDKRCILEFVLYNHFMYTNNPPTLPQNNPSTLPQNNTSTLPQNNTSTLPQNNPSFI
jgi:hypothetical protein